MHTVCTAASFRSPRLSDLLCTFCVLPDARLLLLRVQEVCKREIMEKILVEEKRDIKIYWGTATTGN